MLILLTNDDGIRAPGIAAALKVLRQIGEVHVVAPETVQSATGHGVTVAMPLMTSPVPVGRSDHRHQRRRASRRLRKAGRQRASAAAA